MKHATSSVRATVFDNSEWPSSWHWSDSFVVVQWLCPVSCVGIHTPCGSSAIPCTDC